MNTCTKVDLKITKYGEMLSFYIIVANTLNPLFVHAFGWIVLIKKCFFEKFLTYTILIT